MCTCLTPSGPVSVVAGPQNTDWSPHDTSVVGVGVLPRRNFSPFLCLGGRVRDRRNPDGCVGLAEMFHSCQGGERPRTRRAQRISK